MGFLQATRDMRRRKFLNLSFLTSAAAYSGLYTSPISSSKITVPMEKKSTFKNPISICTWHFDRANAKAGSMLANGENALNAAIAGVTVEEENLKNTTVGKGGAPDREGNVTLDASVMDHQGNCGSVAGVENITHVARLAHEVMKKTPHVMLVGKGAEEFGYKNGFKKEELLTESSKKDWQEWLKTSHYKPIINIENHDTIGILTLDKDNNISAACSTSGLSYKMKGRVGDSPIIGSGLYIDNEIGGAVATGMGEEIMKNVGSFLIVELMRNGYTPQQACEEAIHRIVNKNNNYKNFQVAYIAIDKNGNTGAYCIHSGFTMMKYQDGTNKAHAAQSFIKQ